jgi:ribosomal protein L3 glutamine methyltransferase
MKNKTLQDILNLGEKQFIENKLYFGHGTDNAWDEAVYLALHVLKLSYDVDSSVLNRELTLTERNRILALFQKRIDKKIPAAYLIKEAWFAGLPFYVDERVLIPRSPIAELIQAHFFPWHISKKTTRILDLCTGSGCIAIACAVAFPNAVIDAADIDEGALAVAKINIKKHKMEKRIKLIKSDVFSALKGKKYDIIVSNPPYVDADEMTNLPTEYRHEPKLALAAGQDGLAIVDRILQAAKNHLTADGILVVEVGATMDALLKKYPKIPFIWPEFVNGGDGVFVLLSLAPK